jgi:hypothetical protein
VTGAAVVAALGPAGAAHAASSACSIPILRTSCVTGTVTANPFGAWVDITIQPSSFCSVGYKVRDVNNWVVVRADRVGYPFTATIGGLYSSYRLELSTNGSCSAYGWIDNEV